MLRMGSIVFFIVIMVLTAGCGSNKKAASVSAAPETISNSPRAADNSAATPSAAVSQSQSGTAALPISITDGTGVKLDFPKRVERVACLTEICSDSLAELGLEPVAITPFGVAEEKEFFGDKAKSFGQIGGSFMEPSLEDIAKAKPELVIGLEGTHEGLRDGLKSIAPLYIAKLASYQDSIAFLDIMGKLTGKEAEAAKAKLKLLDKIAYYKEKSPKNKSALIIYGADVNFGIDTAGSIVGGMLAEVTKYPWPAPEAEGGHQAGGMTYSLEKVLATNPDQLFIETFAFGPDTKPLTEQFKVNPLWAKLKAVKDNHVNEVRTVIWANGRGTRSLGIVLDEAMKSLYPDVFKEAVQ